MFGASVSIRQVLRMKDGQVWDKQSLYMKAIELDGGFSLRGFKKGGDQNPGGIFWDVWFPTNFQGLYVTSWWFFKYLLFSSQTLGFHDPI